jgi:hypothetical protein
MDHPAPSHRQPSIFLRAARRCKSAAPKLKAWLFAGASLAASVIIFRHFLVDPLALIGGVIAAIGALALGLIEQGHQSPSEGSRIVILISIFFGAVLAVVGSQIDGDKLLRKQEELTSLAQQNLAWVTGGNEFVDLQNDFWTDQPGTMSFSLVKGGDYPAYEVTFRITDVDARTKYAESYSQVHHQLPPFEMISAASTNVVTRSILFPHTIQPRVITLPITSMDHHSYVAEIFARNGHAGYLYKLIIVNNRWLVASRVDREIGGKKQAPIENIPLGFPLNSSGKVDW